MTASEEHLTLRQASARFGVSTPVLRRLVVRGDLPGAAKRPTQSGAEWVVPASSVAALVVQSTPAGTEAEREPAPGGADSPLPPVAEVDGAAEVEGTGELDDLEVLRPAWQPPRRRQRIGPGGVAAVVVVVLFLAVVGALLVGDRDGAELAEPAESTGADPGPAAEPVEPVERPGEAAPDAAPPAADAEPDAAPPAADAEPDAAPPAAEAEPGAAPSTAPVDAASTTLDPGSSVVVEQGESFWSIAEAIAGPGADLAEVHSTWVDLIEANRDALPDPGNPDLLFVGTLLTVP